MSDTPYDDGLSADEEAKLREEEGAAAPASIEAPAGDAAPGGAPPPPPPPAPAPTEDDEFQAFLAKHEGKTAEEISRLAFQQSKRANAQAFEARRTGETLDAFQRRLAGALERSEAKRSRVADDTRRFQDLLEKDPDAANKMLFDRLQERELSEADQGEDEARMDAALALANQAIPDFQKVWPEIRAFGEEMGYKPDELAGIRDGRDIITLYCARGFANLFKAGVVDLRGNLLQMPDAVAATDPRLQRPEAVSTLSSAPARTPAGSKTSEARIAEIMAMSDADFAKLPQEDVDQLLAAVSGGAR